jgi:hypothetical protein
LRYDDNQSGVNFFANVELSEIPRVVRHERVVLRNDAGHQIPILFAAKAKPIDVESIVTGILSNGHERRVQALVK